MDLQSIYEELREDEYEIRRLKEKRKNRYASIFPGTIDYSREKDQTSASNQMESWMADVDQLDRKICNLEDKLYEKRRHYTQLYNLDKHPVIKAHYIDLIPWGRVGARLGISRWTVHRRRKEYEEKMSKKEKNEEKSRNS